MEMHIETDQVLIDGVCDADLRTKIHSEGYLGHGDEFSIAEDGASIHTTVYSGIHPNPPWAYVLVIFPDKDKS
jgi:hypothetical protein